MEEKNNDIIVNETKEEVKDTKSKNKYVHIGTIECIGGAVWLANVSIS